MVVAQQTAQARTWTHVDPRGDVVTIADDGTFEPAPNRVASDVIKARLRHTHHRVRVRVTLVDLVRNGDRIASYGLGVLVRTSEGLQRLVTLEFAPGGRTARVGVFNRNGVSVRCRGIRHAIEYRRNTVFVGVPRRCLSNPRWVRVGAVGTAQIADPNDDLGTPLFDDALQDGFTPPSRLSPRLYRGLRGPIPDSTT
jgi:hypothetical protein